MPTPGEHKTVQARILAYAQEIGWTFVPRSDAQQRRGFDASHASPAEQAAEASMQKFILRQHQAMAVEKVEKVVERCLSAPPQTEKRRGLVWHTQGSGKTYTMIKTAELLFKAAAADKPTVILLIDRNELEDQMLRNLAMLGLGNVQHANRMTALNKLLKDDYRGIINYRRAPCCSNQSATAATLS